MTLLISRLQSQHEKAQNNVIGGLNDRGAIRSRVRI